MSVELASLYGQVYDLSRIRVCQSEVNDASLEIVTEPRLPFQNDDNAISPETMVEPNLASNNEKSGADLETTPELHLTSANNRSYEMEDSKGPSLTNIIGVSGRGSNDEFLTVEDNETTEPREDPLLGENRLSIAFNFSEERTKTTNDVGANDSEQELSLNVSVVGTSLINAGAASPVIAEVDPLDSSGHATGYIGDASDGTVPRASLDESGQTNACASTCTAVVPDRKIAAPSVDFGFADFDDGQAIVRNEDTEKDGGAGGEGETEIGLKDDILLGVSQDAAAVEVVPNADHGELESNAQSEIYSTTSKEEVRFSCPGPVSMLQDCSMNNCENPDHQEAYQPSMMDEESGFDLHDRDELNYLAAENDTEFLNVDDDELTEMADDCMPEAEEAQYTENSGWSSRTRAVSKYLQSAFVKEAEHGRKSLSMDNLLNGKSRKEASRMFFEALVLKTRDYIHVEQRNPFDNITIISRPRLMKSGF